MEKETIVLLPGYDGDGQKTFNKLVGLLKNKFEMVLIDYPYLDNHDKQYNLDELVDLIHNKVGGQIKILGFSMGGFVANAYVNKYPRECKKIILVSSSTSPELDKNLKKILFWANILLKNRATSFLLTWIFLKLNLKNFPLPHPGNKFKSSQGYAIFGSLAKIMMKSQKTCNCKNKLAIFFDDDNSFPTNIYKPILVNQKFKVVNFKSGGHAEGSDYWEKVASCL